MLNKTVIVWAAVAVGAIANEGFSQSLATVTTAASLDKSNAPPKSEILPDEGIKGALVMIGGGRITEAVRNRFIELAGGKDARLVVIPTASQDVDLPEDTAELKALWQSLVPKPVVILHTRLRDEANRPEFSEPLRQATAVWISGGFQSQLATAYSGTKVEDELHNVLKRGGVVGGTSAGAAIMSRKMIVRGAIYDHPGWGLLPGAMIDQHFLARDRKSRLIKALDQYPDQVGFGIDEGTALIVQGGRLSVLGNSTVTVLTSDAQDHKTRELIWKSGEGADVAELKRELHRRR